METRHTHPEILEALTEAKRTICALKLSLMAHPDCTEGSEFDDMTTRLQEMEDEIESLLKKATELNQNT